MLPEYLHSLLGEGAACELKKAMQENKTVVIRGPQGPTGKSTLCRVLQQHGIRAVEEKDTFEVVLDTQLKSCIPNFDPEKQERSSTP